MQSDYPNDWQPQQPANPPYQTDNWYSGVPPGRGSWDRQSGFQQETSSSQLPTMPQATYDRSAGQVDGAGFEPGAPGGNGVDYGGTESSSRAGGPQPSQDEHGKANPDSNTEQGAAGSEATSSLKKGMACKFCRKRKLRCSGERPTCASCVKYKQPCEYQPPRLSVLSSMERPTDGDNTQRPTPAYNAIFNSQPLSYETGLPSQQYDQPTFSPPQPFFPYTVGAQQPISLNTFNVDSNFHNSSSSGIAPAAQSFHDSSYDPQPNLTSFVPYPSYPPDPSAYATTPMLAPSPLTMSLPQSATFQPVLTRGFPSARQHTGFPGQDLVSTGAPINATSSGFSFSAEHGTATTPLVPSQGFFREPTFPLSPPFMAPASTASSNNSASAFVPLPRDPDPFALPSINRTVEAQGKDAVEGLSERLGEFLFSPNDSPVATEGTGSGMGSTSPPENVEWQKKRKTSKSREGQQWIDRGGRVTSDTHKRTSLLPDRSEPDGLSDADRNVLLDIFLNNHRLFFEMSIPTFRYRMTFKDKRRPSLALLYAMYLWSTRLSQGAKGLHTEQHFFNEANRHLEVAAASNDRLIDAVRAAMLLGAYTYTNGRHHEGWLIAGLAVRLVLSTGINRIPSLTFNAVPPNKNPHLRNRVFLLAPPEDAIELAERVHAFWCVYSIERCGALATGFPSAINDNDIITPFGKPLDDIASQSVTSQDDVSVRDLYRNTPRDRSNQDSEYMRWVKAVTILERTSKLAFLDPTDDSDYSRSQVEYTKLLRSPNAPSASPPPSWLNQPKYRNPKEYHECLLGVNKLRDSLGVDTVFPVERKRKADAEGVKCVIGPKVILLHHHFAATEMLLHDINSVDADNKVAVQAARKSIDIFKYVTPLAFHEVDAEIVLVWCLIAKVLIKELDRFARLGDTTSCNQLSDDIDINIAELNRIGMAMHMSRTQAKAMEEMKKMALAGLSSQ